MRATYVTLSDKNSALLGPNDTFFVDTYVNLPHPWILHNTVVALLDIEGHVVPRLADGKTFYLCGDFVENSMLQLDDDKIGMFPVLRRLTFDKTLTVKIGNEMKEAHGIQECLNQMLYVPCSRQEVHTFRLYLIDTHGQMVSFDHFTLRCTLLTTHRA